MASIGPSSQVVHHLNISGYAKTHIGNVYQCIHDLVDGRSEQEQILTFRKALYFDTIDHRRQQIEKDHFETISPQSLNWIWETNLAEWLSSDEPMFWVCGKPGSGKSTLMNYIATNSKTNRQLSANGKTWTIIQFHFDFRAGTSIANTPEGMLRSLILQLTDRCKEFRQLLTSQNELHIDVSSVVSMAKLETLMATNLAKMDSSVCAFIDGLDEYAGSYLQLGRLLLALQRLTGMKICLASRPEAVLSRQLQDLPQIVMQSHNDVAIRAYLESTIHEVLSERERSLIDSLLTRLVEEANGVILWARLVADELITSVPIGCSLLELETMLDQIPNEVEDMYARVLDKLPQHSRLQTAVMLKLVVAYQDNNASILHRLNVENLLVASVLTLENISQDVSSSLSTLTLDQYVMRIHAMLGGLVETLPSTDSDPGELLVRLVHKTLSTYLRRSRWIENVLGPEFDASFSDLWFRISVQSLQRFSKLDGRSGLEMLQEFAPKLCGDEWPRSICIEDLSTLSLGKDVFHAQFVKILTTFLGNCIMNIPNYGQHCSPICTSIMGEVMSCPLMALHGALEKKDSYLSDRSTRCGCKWMLYWTKARDVCGYPQLIYAIRHRLFAYFKTEYSALKEMLSSNDQLRLLEAAAECSLNSSIRISRPAGQPPPDKFNAEVIEILLADRIIEPEHLTIFLFEEISKQVPRYVSRFLSATNLEPILLKGCIPDTAYMSDREPDTLLCCWASSPVSDPEALALRLNVLLQLGQSSHDPCAHGETIFHLLQPASSYNAAYASTKLRILLQANQDLPEDFKNGNILKDLRARCDYLEDMIQYDMRSNDYNAITYSMPMTLDEKRETEDFMQVLEQHLAITG